jgi:5'-phosphate synthase pdxT subunit
MRIGILALQGAFHAHAQSLKKLNVETILVKTGMDLQNLDGLILPGGESTTHLKLLENSDLISRLQEFYQNKSPIFGTCAGLILIAQNIINYTQFCFNFLPVEIERNGYGSQKESFCCEIDIPSLGEPKFPCVFIRAPKISKMLSNEVKILATWQNVPILVQKDKILGATFHPELTNDLRIHQLFIQMCKNHM